MNSTGGDSVAVCESDHEMLEVCVMVEQEASSATRGLNRDVDVSLRFIGLSACE